MRIMTHVTVAGRANWYFLLNSFPDITAVWDVIRAHNAFVKCTHSVGCPEPVKGPVQQGWLCNPERTLILHLPDKKEIWSFGSGYGGNSLLGKKCLALRLGSTLARDEGWLAEHMLIMSVTNDATGREYFFTAAFPSACGKTNLAMLTPALPGYTVKTIGDDIAWMHFNADGRLMAVNPELGMFGVAPGTSNQTNPTAMKMLEKDALFTNVGLTRDGDVFWEGLENEINDKDQEMTSWQGRPWHIGDTDKCAQPNARFTCSIRHCPILHPRYDSPEGVPIDAVIFGGRRPEGVPLVYESFNWAHGVFLGASVKSELTAAQEQTGGKRTIRHDPMGMRPFMGYNFGDYLQHWLDMEKPDRKMPKIFHVNWFRKDAAGKYIWPGFGQNIRVLQWMMDRLEGRQVADTSPIGYIPKTDGSGLNLTGVEGVDVEQLLSVPADYWLQEEQENRQWLSSQLGAHMPAGIQNEINAHRERILSLTQQAPEQPSGSGTEPASAPSTTDPPAPSNDRQSSSQTQDDQPAPQAPSVDAEPENASDVKTASLKEDATLSDRHKTVSDQE